MDRFKACIITGAIGDAWGSSYEYQTESINPKTFYWGTRKAAIHNWSLTDDTQLTLASCEALLNDHQSINPEVLSSYFVKYYQQNRLSGIGASTLKAITELAAGGHWSQVGRAGEYAAGNGAAMRIAPFAFFPAISRELIRDLCRITHRNDEAYIGALAIVLTIRAILNNDWVGEDNIFDIVISQLPDTKVRDRLLDINERSTSATIADIAKLGTNGYVVNTVPFAIFAASQVTRSGITGMFQSIIKAGGDTDTNASIAGQIAGALLGPDHIPDALLIQLETLPDYKWLKTIVDKTSTIIPDCNP